ncbi:MAG: hypothetical protein AAF404_07505 [Pseudomonadota bacterium]
MHPTIQEHKIPISVTFVGLVVAGVLASAPALLAESDTEILTKKNASDLQALTASLDNNTADLQQQLDAQSSTQLAAIDRLQNQVAILNKAAGRLNQKQAALLTPAVELSGSFAKLKTNAETRLTNLEKAVTRMNQRQRGLLKNAGKAEPPTEPDRNTALRLSNLEKGVKNLHLKTVANQPTDNSNALSDIDTRLSSLENKKDTSAPDIALRLAALEVLVASYPTDQSTRLTALERQVAQLQFVRPQAAPLPVRSSQSDIKHRVDTNVRLLRLERQLKRLENRLEDMNGASGQQDLVIDQLFEMRGYIDTLLSEINR